MYLEHNKRWNEYIQAQQDLEEINNECEEVLQRAFPKGNYSERVSGTPKNKTEEYVIEVERRNLKRRKEYAKEVVETKKYLLELCEEQLRKSRDIYDLIYTKKWVDHKRPKDIYRELDFMGMSYSRSHIYVVIKRIRQQIGRDF